MRKDSPALQQALWELEHLHPKKIDLGLERIERVLKKLGNPQHKLPPTIHIAGTNGKGSTTAFLHAMAEAQGLRVHVYTSPHLVSFCERIVLAGDIISEPALLDILARVQEANDGKPLSFFEATTAAGFLAFSETSADLLILEVGLGGRFDATNVIDSPAASVITPIDYDHAEFLGRDLAQITREKSGIFKAHSPAFSAEQTSLVRAVLDAEASKTRCKLQSMGEQFSAYAQQGRLIFEDENTLFDLPLPTLRGAHQIMNAGLAVAVAKSLLIDERAIAKGIETAVWPARLQPLSKGPLAKIANAAGAQLWLDGGHNPHAGRALASAMAELDANEPRPLILIMGILANKDAPGFLDAFEGLAQKLVAVPIKDHASLSPESLTDIAKGRGIKADASDSVETAIIQILKTKTKVPPRILICGSLYLAGTVLAQN
ncbi:MAG: bifunctional folylpolyglutamate synthase/dihydrofolate synthase [Robiginitomaculum sp.]|nr:MAG: bifunctional folylpolyglutamate synthase/dihydrofolate synthase [Robiginitomaculum sp.]